MFPWLSIFLRSIGLGGGVSMSLGLGVCRSGALQTWGLQVSPLCGQRKNFGLT